MRSWEKKDITDILIAHHKELRESIPEDDAEHGLQISSEIFLGPNSFTSVPKTSDKPSISSYFTKIRRLEHTQKSQTRKSFVSGFQGPEKA